MKISKRSIRLSDSHPSLPLRLQLQPGIFAPLIVNEDGVLIDGYRRLKLSTEAEVDSIVMPASNIFEAAFSLNNRTRVWDETDCFLWARWAQALGVLEIELPVKSFPASAWKAARPLVDALANRAVTFRQFSLLAECPERYRAVFLQMLTETIQLNSNETAVFLDIAADLIQLEHAKSANDLFSLPSLAAILADSRLNRRQKGERLLVEMRVLRYPYYSKKSREFSANWGLLGLETLIQAKKSLFLQRGSLEIALTAASLEEFKQKVTALNGTLQSPVWEKIWDES